MFLSSRIIQAEITKDAQDKIIKIYLVAQLQDDSIVGTKEFDYVIDGGTLDEIRENLQDGMTKLLTEQSAQKHQEWVKETINEVKSDLTPAQIIGQFGFNEITKL